MGEKDRHEMERGEINGIQPVSWQNVTPRDRFAPLLASTTNAMPTTKMSLVGCARLRLSMGAYGGGYAGGEALTITLYRLMRSSSDDEGVYTAFGTTLSVTTPALLMGETKTVEVTDAANLVEQATHYKVTGDITLGAGVTGVVEFEKLGTPGPGFAAESGGHLEEAADHLHSIDAKLSSILALQNGGDTVVNTLGASGDPLLAATAGKKHRIYKLFVVAGASTTVALSDGCGTFLTDASGRLEIDFNPVGDVQTTANTAITITTGDASAWKATAVYKNE